MLSLDRIGGENTRAWWQGQRGLVQVPGLPSASVWLCCSCSSFAQHRRTRCGARVTRGWSGSDPRELEQTEAKLPACPIKVTFSIVRTWVMFLSC